MLLGYALALVSLCSCTFASRAPTFKVPFLTTTEKSLLSAVQQHSTQEITRILKARCYIRISAIKHALELAVRNNDSEALMALLEKPFDDMTEECLSVPLIWAAREGDIYIIGVILGAYDDKINNSFGQSHFENAISEAIKNNHLDIALQLLLRLPKASQTYLDTLLIAAVENDREDIALHLVNLYDKIGNTYLGRAFYKAAEKGQTEFFNFLLQNRYSKIYSYLREAIVHAARGGNVKIFKSLLSKRSDIDRKYLGDALVAAIEKDRKDIVLLLIAPGVSVDPQDIKRAFIAAVQKGQPGGALLLLAQFKNYIGGEDLERAIVSSAEQGGIALLEILLNKRFPPSPEEAKERLIQASKGENMSRFHDLIQASEDKNMSEFHAILEKRIRNQNFTPVA